MISSLAYLGITTPAVDAWPSLATEVLGCMLAEPGADGAVRLRVDDAAWRLQFHPGERDDIAYIGWAVKTMDELEAMRARLTDRGIEVHDGDEATTADRAVKKLIWFVDDFGFRHEIITAQMLLPGSFRPGRAMSGFVTGEQGLGHVVLGVPDVEKAHAFFTEVFDFKLSDWLKMDNGFEGRFYHCNGRHHTLALGELDGMKGLNHLMLEVGDIDDVGIALDMCEDRGVPVTNGLGRHTNDLMTSFYFETPSSFLIEYGWSGLQIDAGWDEKNFSRPSIWGHRPPDGAPFPAGLVMPA